MLLLEPRRLSLPVVSTIIVVGSTNRSKQLTFVILINNIVISGSPINPIMTSGIQSWQLTWTPLLAISSEMLDNQGWIIIHHFHCYYEIFDDFNQLKSFVSNSPALYSRPVEATQKKVRSHLQTTQVPIIQQLHQKWKQHFSQLK